MIRFLWVNGRLSSALLALALVLAAVGCGGGTPTVPPENPSAWYVSPQGSDTQNTCHSYQSPCLTINGVLSQASNPALIYIAPGTYNENILLYDMTVDLEGSGLGTILNGGITHPAEGGVIGSLCNSYNTSQCNNSLTIANLTIQNGWSEDYGGGVFVSFTTLVMRNVILSGNQSSKGGGLYIDTSTATLDNVTVLNNSTISAALYGPYDGAGIYNNKGHLIITNSMIAGNMIGNISGDGGGIFNLGSADLHNVIIAENSVLEGNGGGIKNGGNSAGSVTLDITNSTLRDNHSTHGGGLLNDHAQVNITGTTINNNSSISYNASGGGILNTNSGTLVLINSTISGNNGGISGGAITNYYGSTLAMTNDTLANNQASLAGGLFFYQSGPIYLENVLLDGNSGGNCGSLAVSGSLGGSYNISSDTSCDFEGEFNNNGVVTKIGPLQDNGGPTKTHALLPGSPAIDAGSASMAPNIDQRGSMRPRDGNFDGVADYDIGAVEYGLMHITGVQVLALITATPGLVHFTFQEAGPCFSGPGPEYVLVTQAAPGDIAPVYGRTPDGVWFQMFIKPGLLCWSNGNLGTFDGDPFGLPTLLAPPASTPTRTPLPGKPSIPTPTHTQPPVVVCSDYKNKTDCLSHGCTWPLVSGPPICK